MTLEDEAKEQRGLGRQARREGKPANSGPPTGTRSSYYWCEGWHIEDAWIASGGVAGVHRRAEARRLAKRCAPAGLNMLMGG